jgi:fucose permease
LHLSRENPVSKCAFQIHNLHRCNAASVLVASLGCFLIPAAVTFPGLLAAFLIMDTGLGVLICHGNTLCTWANAANPAPAVNIINGGFGAGAFCAPLIVYVFSGRGGAGTGAGGDAVAGTTAAYWAVAALSAALGVCFLAVEAPTHPKLPPPPPPPPEAEEVTAAGVPDSTETTETETMPTTTASSVAVPATALFLALVVGTEISFGAFLVTYASGALSSSNTAAAEGAQPQWGCTSLIQLTHSLKAPGFNNP